MSREVTYIVSGGLAATAQERLRAQMRALGDAGWAVTVFALKSGGDLPALAEFPVFEFEVGDWENLVRMLRHDESSVRIATDWRTAHLLANECGEGGYVVDPSALTPASPVYEARAIVASYRLGLRMVADSADAAARVRCLSDVEPQVVEPSTAEFAARLVAALAPIAADAPGSIAKAARPSVSIVVPTKNAGPDFAYLLHKVETARRAYDIQLIVVDSGSTDATVVLAREFGATVLEIPAEEFSHGGTRNRGADLATGEYIVFLTQDAIPIGESWLDDLVAPLAADPRVAASRGREIPRSDADLFCGWMDWNYHGGYDWRGETVVDLGEADIHSLDPGRKRALAQLTDTCCCIRRSVFSRFRFAEVDFAEDLDLGIRLLERGFKLHFLFGSGVVHSHNREAFYILKRFYVDSKLIPGVLDFRPPTRVLPSDVVNWSIRSTYGRLNAALLAAQSAGGDYFDVLIDSLDKVEPVDEPADPTLDAFFAQLPPVRGSYEPADNVFGEPLKGLLRRFGDYHAAVFGTVEGQERELAACCRKLFASAVGDLLGSNCAANPHTLDPQLAAFDARLSAGV